MKTEFLAKSPLLALPLFAFVLFMVLFLLVVFVTMSRKARAYETMARMPFDNDGDESPKTDENGAQDVETGGSR